MKSYNVIVPVAGSISVCVEAESEDEAKEKALQSDFTIDLKSQDDVELHEFETLESIATGNVCYASQWYIEVEEN